MKKTSIFFAVLAGMTLCSAPVTANPDNQRSKETTTVLKAAIEPGVTPTAPKKYKAVKKANNTGNSAGSIEFFERDELMSGEETIPGTNMSAMILDKLKVSEQVTPETTALFGETIDLNTGAVSLQQTDVSIPGNFSIPVEFRRIYKGAG